MRETIPAESSADASDRASPTREEVMLHLERVLESPAFRYSKRGQNFFRYVVTKVLEGKADNLKERTLASEVFGRTQSWDSSADTIVRVGAREVRKRLAQFYASTEGTNEPIRIELLPGSYVPAFHLARSTSSAVIPHNEEILPSAKPKPAIYRKRIAAIVLAAVTFCVCVLLVRRAVPGSLSAEFWNPVWRSSEPLLIGLAHPLVYFPSSRATRLSLQQSPADPLGAQQPIKLPADVLNGADFLPIFDQFVGLGDATCATNATELAAQHKKQVKVRIATKVEFTDLREANSLLIGAFTNRWTMEFMQKLRFRFEVDSEGKPMLTDSQDRRRIWRIQKAENGNAPEDYFVVSRLLHSPTGKIVLIAGGLTQVGTENAGRLLVNPAQLEAVLGQLPNGWQSKNLEMVLHATVIENSPGPPELVASQIW